MRDDTRALLAKEFREQRPMALVWLALMLFAPVVTTVIFVVGHALARIDSTWAEYLIEAGIWTPGFYRELLLPAAVFAWGGVRVFHRETEAGTHAWLRTMPVPDYVVSWSKAVPGAVYVFAATSALLLVQVGAVAFAGRHAMPEGTILRLAGSWLGQSAAMFHAFALGAVGGVYWRPRSTGRAAALFVALWVLLVVTVLVVGQPGDSIRSFAEARPSIGAADPVDWTFQGAWLAAFGIFWFVVIGREFGRRPAIRWRT